LDVTSRNYEEGAYIPNPNGHVHNVSYKELLKLYMHEENMAFGRLQVHANGRLYANSRKLKTFELAYV
jgi:hypothetical protein